MALSAISGLENTIKKPTIGHLRGAQSETAPQASAIHSSFIFSQRIIDHCNCLLEDCGFVLYGFSLNSTTL